MEVKLAKLNPLTDTLYIYIYTYINKYKYFEK